MKKKLFVLLMTSMMVVTMMPLQVFANATNTGSEEMLSETKATEETKDESLKDSNEETIKDSEKASEKTNDKTKEADPPSTDVLKFTAVDGDVDISMESVGSNPPNYQCHYREGEEWDPHEFGDGSKVTITQNNSITIWADGICSPGSAEGYHRFTMDNHGASGRIKLEGDINGLTYSQENDYALRGVFENCTAIIQAPQCILFEDGSRTHFFDSTFKGCTNLKTQPKIVGSKIAPYCYASMFEGCTSLEQAPSLDSTELAEGCYSNMFAGCSSLEQAPKLPAKKLVKGCYSGMFSGCSSLNNLTVSFTDWNEGESIPTNEWLKGVADNGHFTYLANLDISKRDDSHIPASWSISDGVDYLNFTADSGECFLSMEALGDKQQAPDISYQYSTDMMTWSAFNPGDTKIHIAPGEIVYFRAAEETQSFPSTQDSVGWKFVADNEGGNGKVEASGNLMSLVSQDCLKDSIDDWGFEKLFSDCSILTKAPEMPVTTLGVACYADMFSGCTSLTKPPKLSASNLTDSCYRGMFKNCINLEKAPDLPARKLVDGCYFDMFKGCSKLNVVSVSFINWDDAEHSTENWLSGTSEIGTFACCSEIDSTQRDETHIPSKWKIKNYLEFIEHTGGAWSCLFVALAKLDDAPDVQYEYLQFGGDESSGWQPFYPGETSLTLRASGFYIRASEDSQDFPGNDKGYHTFQVDGSSDTSEIKGDVMSLASKNLSVTEMKPHGFRNLFQGIGGVSVGVSISAETLADYCYANMFEQTNWRYPPSITPPDLPVMKLTKGCYSAMFRGCTRLEKAPDLPATELVPDCYNGMFDGCERLNSVSVGFDNWIDEIHATDNWLHGVAEEGKFICPLELNTSIRDENHIPVKWRAPGKMLFFKAKDGDVDLSMIKNNEAPDVSYQYSSDGEKTWNNFTPGIDIIHIAKDQTICFTAAKEDQDYPGCEKGYLQFVMDAKGGNGKIEAEGSVMSMVSQYSSVADISDYAFYKLFENCNLLYKAPELTATLLAPYCYSNMFEGCGELQKVPDLPAKELAEGCCSKMFKGCTSLEKAPKLPPALELIKDCYSEMFSGCTSLKEAPSLYSRELAEGCYSKMFEGCEKLQKAPDLPATKLTVCCYEQMFENCKNLLYVNAEFTDWDEWEHATDNWLNNVWGGAGGEFHSPSSLDKTKRDGSHIPAGWMTYDWLRFTAKSGHVKLSMKSENDAPKLTYKYSRDGEVWEDFIPDETIVKIEEGEGIYLRSANQDPQVYPGCEDGYLHFVMNDEGSNATVKADGNVESLVCDITTDYIAPYGYYRLFSGCSCLAEPPSMPIADNVGVSSFESMFEGCTKLLKAPKLVATKLENRCYAAMFKGCKNLEIATHLPATSLPEECYKEMFAGCGLNCGVYEFPENLTLSRSCCESMFEGCSNLTDAPRLPAESLAESCYKSMFKGCRSLKDSPDLGAVKLVESCYASMFEGCSSLNHVIARNDEWNDEGHSTDNWLLGVSQNGTFDNINPDLDLSKRDESHIPEGWQTLGSCLSFEAVDGDVDISMTNYYTGVFEREPPNVSYQYLDGKIGKWQKFTPGKDVIHIEKGQKISLCAAEDSQDFPSQMRTDWWPDEIAGWRFIMDNKSTDGKIKIGGNIMSLVSQACSATEVPNGGFAYLFSSCAALTNPIELPATSLHTRCYQGMFSDCVGLKEAPELPVKRIEDNCYSEMFAGCTNLEKGPELPAVEAPADCYSGMFRDCRSLKEAPELPAKMLNTNCYAEMFAGCINIEKAPELPATSVTESCYSGMFRNCKSLKKAPELPATELKANCYFEMFAGCSRLNEVRVGFTQWDEYVDATDNWLSGLKKEGTFICPPELDQTIRDASHIPPGWNINRVSISFNSTAEEGTSGGYYDENGNAIENLDLAIGTTFAVTDDEKTGDKVITFTYPDSTVKKVYVKPGKNSEIKTFTPPASPIEANCEFNTTFGVKTYNVSLTSAEGSIGTGKYYNGETEISSIRVPNNTAVTAEKIDDKTVQINFDNVALITAKADEGSVIEEFAAPESPIKSDCTFCAKFMKEIHTVTFDVQGHGTAPDVQSVNYGESAQKPEDPSEEGYTFGGWYTEKECQNEFDFATPIKADTTLYAKWTINTYTVTFDVQGHGTAPDAQTVNYSDKAQKPADPSEEGYTFGGWYTEKECQNEFDFDTPIKADTTLYAKWTINTYTVTFDVQGHGTAPDSQSVNYGDKAQKPADLRERGYIFGGWYDNVECKGTQYDFNTSIKADLTLYARWSKVIVPEVKGLSAEATDSKTVSVKWNKITGFDGITYELWRREGTSGAFKLVAQGTSNTYKDTKVKTDTKYYYKVRTIRTAQGYTYEGKFCKSDYAYPRLYQVTKLSAIALNAADVQLKWNANGNKNVVYQVYRSTKSDTGFAKVGTITDSKTSFSQSFTPEQSGRKYYYKVRAITKDYTGKRHYGEFSRVDFAFPRVWAVVGFEAWAPNAKCTKVYFKPLPDQSTKYWLYKSTKPTGDFGSPIAKLSYKENLYTDKKVKAGHKYYYMLRPVEVINGKTYFGPYTNVEYAYPR